MHKISPLSANPIQANSTANVNATSTLEKVNVSSSYPSSVMLLHKSKDDHCNPSIKNTDPKHSLKNKEYVLMRTIAVDPKVELEKQANTNPKVNTLGTPSSCVFLSGDPTCLTISSIQTPETAKNKWGGKPNLIFTPTPKETNSRTGLTIVLDHPATLHSCSSASVVKKYNLTEAPPKSDLHERMKVKGRVIEDSWEQGGYRNGRNKGMYGKYTEFATHEHIQGKMFYQQAKFFVEAMRDAIPQSGANLRSYVVDQTKFDVAPDIQKKIFESQKKYAAFLASSSSEGKSQKIVDAVRVYEDYLSKTSNPMKSYFQVIGKETHSAMRMELLQHYENFSQSGYRHSELLGRIFPWEARGIDIGHIDDLGDRNELNKHFSYAKKFSLEYDNSRKEMAKGFKEQGLEHPVVKEFLDAKNGLLKDKGEPLLTESEKSNVLKKILTEMDKPLQIFSYQRGRLEQVDFPQDITIGKDDSSRGNLTKEKFVQISNRLRATFNKQERVSVASDSPSLKPLPEVKFKPTVDTIINNDALVQTAKRALESFLAADIDFELYTSVEDSGALFLKLLKDKTPGLSDRDIVLNNIDKFSLDNCMSIISSMHAKDWDSKVAFETVVPNTQSSDYKSFAYMDYDKSVLHNYASVTRDTKTLSRPQLDTKTDGVKFNFKNLEGNLKKNMIDAWGQRNIVNSIFNKRIKSFIDEVENKYEIPLKSILADDDVGAIWDKLLILQKEKFGEKHKHEITKSLFNALGADWSRSRDIRDESVFRRDYDANEWNINPHGAEYRQHKTGKGALVTLAPSEKAISIAEKEIEKGCNPFKNLEDMYHILDKLKDNQTDRFTLHAIFMDKEVLSGPSSSSLRMLNFWEREVLPSLSDEDKKVAPTLMDIAKLNEAYNTGGKQHHSAFEVESVTRNRNVQNS